ncbi:MAG: PAS domain S-box protein [Bacteroidales bacterium]|nr:PAS domain S-box protein [Bacteroidales bacterium]
MENNENLSRSQLLAELKKSRRIIEEFKKQADKATDRTALESYLLKLLDTLPDVIFVIDEQGTYLDCKTGNPDQLAFPPEQLIGLGISEVFPPNYVNLILDTIAKVLHDNKRRTIQYDIDIQGNNLIYDAIISPFEPGKVIVLVRNITDRKNIEFNFQKSQNKYQELLDLAPDMFFLGNKNGDILECNQKALSVLGYSINELLGKQLSTIFDIESIRQNPLQFDRLFGGEHIIKERLILTKGGERIPVEMSSRKMNDGTFQTFIRDISERRNHQRQLQQANTTLQGIFDTVLEAIYVLDESGTFIEVNQGACAMYGYTRAQLIGQNPNDLAAAGMNDMEQILAQQALTLKTGKVCGFEFWARSSTGRVFPKEVIVSRGTFYGKQVLIATARDISAQKQAEKHIRESEKKYRQLFETIRQGVFYHDDKGRIIQSNPAAQLIFGLSEAELTNGLLSYEKCRWIDEDSQPMNDENYPGYLALKSGKSIHDFVLGIFNPEEKKYRWILMNAYPEFENNDEKPHQVHVSFTDITALKEVEKRLEHSEETYRNLFQNAQVGIFRTRLSDGKIIECNERLAQMFGYDSREEVIKEFYTEGNYVDKGLRQKVLETLRTEGKALNIEAQFYRKDKSIIWGSYSAKIYEDKGWVEGVAADITDRKIAEDQLIEAKNRAEESDRLKSAFLANVSHEIRTPMNGILGFTQLLQNKNLEQKDRQQYLEIIEKSGDRLLETVNNLVDISKIETGQVPIKFSTLEIEKQLLQHFQFFESQAKQKGFPLYLNVQLPKEVKSIATDVSKFNSIITNLLKNAIKYTRKGYVEFGCYMREKQLVIYVKDTGYGIPENRKKAIFNRFEQADITDRMALQGAGLGLSIVKAYAEMLEGSVWLESEAGEGTTFYFELPIGQPVHYQEATDSVNEDSLKYDQSPKLRILIAEDDPSSALYLEIMLRNLDAELLFASSGAETLELFRKNPDLNLILMDIKMPKGSGLDVTRQIRETNSLIPIIAQTAYAMAGDEEQVLAAGCNAYITKPVRRQILLQLIQQVLS